jgi:hypothetical protein
MNDIEELFASEETNNMEFIYKSQMKSCEKYNDLVISLLFINI